MVPEQAMLPNTWNDGEEKEENDDDNGRVLQSVRVRQELLIVCVTNTTNIEQLRSVNSFFESIHKKDKLGLSL